MVFRYDGNTFERLDSTNGITSIRSLFVDSRDRLWIGTNANGFAVMERGEYRIWDRHNGLVYGLTLPGDLFTLRDGALEIWLACDDCRVQDVVDAFLRLVDKGEFRDPDDVGGGSMENIENIHSKES